MKPCWWDDPDFAAATCPRPTEASKWTVLFMKVAQQVSNMVKCSSRRIGAVIVRDRQILSYGYNGSPAGSSLCQDAGFCPRKRMGFQSGKGLDHCPAQHAEHNSISNAAKTGIAVNGATLYAWCPLPCKDCAGAIITAGIRKVVCLEGPVYDMMAELLFQQAGVEIEYVKESACIFDGNSS
jgi:dCMP deaminase